MTRRTPDEMRAYLEEVRDELLMMREIDNLEMYRVLTDLGKDLEGVSEEERTDENFVYGCVSNVYIADDFEDGAMRFRGVSDAHVIRGYLAVLCRALSGLAPEELLLESREAVERFARDTDLKASLTPNRANAFGNIYQLMREKAERRLRERPTRSG